MNCRTSNKVIFEDEKGMRPYLEDDWFMSWERLY